MNKEKVCNNIGKLYFRDKFNNRQVGTGILIKYKKQWIIMTAAHCIYDIEYHMFNHAFIFVNKKKKLRLQRAYVLDKWSDSQLLEYDLGILVVDVAIEDSNLCKDIYIDYTRKNKSSYKVGGYLSYFPFRNPRLSKSLKTIEDNIYKSTMKGFKFSKFGGMSGSPIFNIDNNKYCVSGVVSFSFLKLPKYLWFLQYDEKIIYLINKSIDNYKNYEIVRS